jgi:HEAT repeat protein
MTDQDASVAASAIEALTPSQAQTLLDSLLKQHTHPDLFVRLSVLQALTRAHVPAVITPILAALNDPEPRIRAAAAESVDLLIEWFGLQVPLEPLLAALNDGEPSVRENALYTFAKHPQVAPIDQITAMLSDRNPYVQCAALRVLEQFSAAQIPPEISSLLQTLSHNPGAHVNVRKGAHRALLLLKGFPLGRAHDFPGEEI